jgi:hypothetical protein
VVATPEIVGAEFCGGGPTIARCDEPGGIAVGDSGAFGFGSWGGVVIVARGVCAGGGLGCLCVSATGAGVGSGRGGTAAGAGLGST